MKNEYMSVKRSWGGNINISILAILAFMGLMWYYSPYMRPDTYYWFVGISLICLSHVTAIIFLTVTPHCKVKNKCLYLYIAIIKTKKIRLLDIARIDVTKTYWKGEAFKFMLVTGEEFDYFPHDKNAKLLCKLKVFFETHVDDARCSWKPVKL